MYRLCEETAPHLHKPKPHFDISGQEPQLKGIKTELDLDIFIFLGKHYQHILLFTLFWGSRSLCSWLSLAPASWAPAAPCLWALAGRDDKHFTTNSSIQALQLQIFKRKLWFQECLFALENVIWVSGYAGSHKLLCPVVPAWFQETSTYSRELSYFAFSSEIIWFIEWRTPPFLPPANFINVYHTSRLT